MTQPTAEQLRLARECAITAAHSARFDDEILSFWTVAWSDKAKGIFEEGATQSALLAIQATEARMAAVEAERERCARIVEDWPDNGISKQALWRLAAKIRSQFNA